ncbi:MAG: carboxypeptidase-like regulatory domain-containing protein [Bryobacteraceae bacterium]
MRLYCRCVSLLLLFIFLACTQATAQSTFGSIVGTVVDATGAGVPSASVQVVNEGTGITRDMTTNDRGGYEVTHLIGGRYSVTVTAAGFKKYENRGVTLENLRTLRIDIKLDLGTIQEQVTVSGAAPVVETESATISSVRTTKQLQDMPLNLRTMAGNLGDTGAWAYVNTIPTGSGRGVTMSMGGSRASMFDVNVDGISTRSSMYGNLTPTSPSLETVQEVRLDYVNNRAEFSEVANMTLITRSGENQFHGRASWDMGNKALNSRGYFDTATAKANRNDIGGVISGPIKRNKAFFVADYEAQRRRYETSVIKSVPTSKMRDGDFSELLAQSTPITLKDPSTGSPFSGNIIPSTRLYAGSVNYTDHYIVAPNYGSAASYTSNYRDLFGFAPRQDHITSRVDYQFSSSNMAYVRVTYQRSYYPAVESVTPDYGVGYREQVRNNRNVAFSDTWTLTPNVINEFKVGFSRNYNPREGSLSGQEMVSLLGIQGLPAQAERPRNIPGVSIGNVSAVQSREGLYPAENVYQASDQVTYIVGRHTLKGGVGFSPQQANQRPATTFGSYSFSNRFTGFGYADFLLGLPGSTSRSFTPQPITTSYYFLNGFLQDDFRVNSKLTLSYGLRYEYNSPPTDRFDVVYNFDPATGSLVVSNEKAAGKVMSLLPTVYTPLLASEAGFPERSLRNADKNNFLPRFGFAYRPFGHNRSVVRGGYGIFSDSLTGHHFTRLYGGPFSGSEGFTNSISSGVTALTLQYPFLDRGTGSITAGNLSVAGESVNLRNAYAQQWNLTLEQDLGQNFGLRMSYIGTKSNQLLYMRNITQPRASTTAFTTSRRVYPNYSGVSMLENGGNASYHALSTEIERKWANGVYFQAAWTWQKSLTDVDEWSGAAETGLQIEDAYDRSRERGDSTYLPRQRFISNLVWELPFGPGKSMLNGKGVVPYIFGGWELSTSVMLQTGNYFTPSFSGVDPSNTNSYGGRPDRIADGNLPSGERTTSKWFDASAFTAPASGRGSFGNCGKSVLIGPGRQSVNLAAFKDFRLAERLKLRFQGSFTNAFNHPSFGTPNSSISSPATVGTITSVFSADSDYGISGPRTGLVGIRLDF